MVVAFAAARRKARREKAPEEDYRSTAKYESPPQETEAVRNPDGMTNDYEESSVLYATPTPIQRPEHLVDSDVYLIPNDFSVLYDTPTIQSPVDSDGYLVPSQL